MNDEKKMLIQCDFDGTVTKDDASFAILDRYTKGQWEALFSEYQQGRMTVGEFNNRAFSQVKADKDTLISLVDEMIRLREGFPEFIRYCSDSGYRIVFVSNGLDFYIDYLFRKYGFDGLEFHASITEFTPEGLSVRHTGPDGNFIDDDVKAAYTESYIAEGYDVVYLGDGRSDIYPARKCKHVFATGSLIKYCGEEKLDCTPFDDFFTVIQTMESWR